MDRLFIFFLILLINLSDSSSDSSSGSAEYFPTNAELCDIFDLELITTPYVDDDEICYYYKVNYQSSNVSYVVEELESILLHRGDSAECSLVYNSGNDIDTLLSSYSPQYYSLSMHKKGLSINLNADYDYLNLIGSASGSYDTSVDEVEEIDLADFILFSVCFDADSGVSGTQSTGRVFFFFDDHRAKCKYTNVVPDFCGAETTSNPTTTTSTTSFYIDSQTEAVVAIPNVIEMTFPAYFFPFDVSIEINSLLDSAQVSLFEETTLLHRSINIENMTDNQIHISLQPQLHFTEYNLSNASFTATINVPDEIISATPSDYGFDVFALILQDGDDEEAIPIYVLFESEYDATQQILFATLNPTIFSDNTASLIIASTPGVRNVARRRLASSECEASSLLCPVEGGCGTVISPFSKTRLRTVKGKTGLHYGTDYRAAVGTSILAAASGTIERSRNEGAKKGYGQYLVIRHTDGSATLYGHLSERLVNAKETVNAGDIIGKSGESGFVDGPHLHLDYVPNGSIYNKKNRIDPDACIDSTMTGSITVGDSGALADDSFSIAIDGNHIGTTTIGAWNTMAVNNLLSGSHQLTLTVTYAPDDVGTYTVNLQDGLVFDDGTTSKSGIPPQGTVVEWTFIVP